MSGAIAALGAGIAAVLAARGASDLAALVARGEIELVGQGEEWTIGERSVRAERVAILLDAPDLVWLGADPARLDAIREAAATALRSPSTELSLLTPVLRLPAIGRGWHHVYRQAARRPPEDRPSDAAVLAGAAALLEAEGAADAATIARRATLEHAEVPSAGPDALGRWVLRLQPGDFVRADRDPSLRRRLSRAVEAAATRATERVTSVDLALAVGPPEP